MILWGGVLAQKDIGVNQFIAYFTESISIIGVNIFVLITGFFLHGSTEVGIRKIFNLYFVMVFYDVAFYIIGILGDYISFSAVEAILTFVPFATGRRWFVETYIILMVMYPFLNKMLGSLDRRSYRLLLGVLLVLFVIWPSFLPSAPILDRGYGITNFITLFCIAGYIRRFDVCVSRQHCWFIFAGSCLITFGIACLVTTSAWDYCFITNIVGSVSLFLLFKEMDMKERKWIGLLSKTSFGVFLIHSTRSLWILLYQKVLRCNEFYESPFFLIHCIISVLAIFAVSAVIDLVRTVLWNKTIDRVLDKLNFMNIKVKI